MEIWNIFSVQPNFPYLFICQFMSFIFFFLCGKYNVDPIFWAIQGNNLITINENNYNNNPSPFKIIIWKNENILHRTRIFLGKQTQDIISLSILRLTKTMFRTLHLYFFKKWILALLNQSESQFHPIKKQGSKRVFITFILCKISVQCLTCDFTICCVWIVDSRIVVNLNASLDS